MRKIKKILVIKGTISQYGALRYFTDEMFSAFCKLGYLVTLFDMMHINFSNFNTSSFNDYDLIFSFNGVGIEMFNSLDKKPLFWTFLVDHPFYHHARLKQIEQNVIVSCIDRNHVAYVDRYYKKIPWVCFMPHGGIIGPKPKPIPFSEKKYDTIFMGSLSNMEETNEMIQAVYNEWGELITPVLDNALSDPVLPLENIVLNVLNSLEIHANDSFFTEIMYIISPIDSLRRYYKRCNLVKTLCEHDIFIEIWGSGWDQFLNENNCNNKVKIHENVEFNETKYIMNDARIVLNDMPLFFDGSHERVFATIQSGAISVSDKSIYLEECFTDNENILFYDIEQADAISTNINSLLNNPEQAQRMINDAYKTASLHTWENRAAAIIEISGNL